MYSVHEITTQTATLPQLWQGFEVSHGNEDTFREMLRIKRSVKDKYSTASSFNIPAVTLDGEPTTETVMDPMAAIQKDVMFVRGTLFFIDMLVLVQYQHGFSQLQLL